MKKYYSIFKYHLARFLCYRLRLLIWISVDALQFSIFPFIWLGIYGSRNGIAGFSQSDIVTYYIILGLISVGFTSHAGKYVREDIMKGDLNKSLVRPENHFAHTIVSEISYKIITTAIALVCGLVLYLLVPRYLVVPRHVLTVVFFILSILITFGITHCIEYLVGMTAFWLGETRALKHTVEMSALLFAGSFAPLSFYPETLQKIAHALPFKFIGFVPAEIYLGHVTTTQTLQQLAIGLVWLAILGLFCACVWRKGLRTYEGVGI